MSETSPSVELLEPIEDVGGVERLAQPEVVVTSGLGGTFPSGLVIGKVSKLEPSSDGLFKSGSVELDPRLADVSEVTVLVPLNKTK